jgi:hypothetical protein
LIPPSVKIDTVDSTSQPVIADIPVSLPTYAVLSKASSHLYLAASRWSRNLRAAAAEAADPAKQLTDLAFNVRGWNIELTKR